MRISSRAIKYNLCAAGEAWINARKVGTSKFLRIISSSSAGKCSIEDTIFVASELDLFVIKAVAGVAWTLDSIYAGGSWLEGDIVAGEYNI